MLPHDQSSVFGECIKFELILAWADKGVSYRSNGMSYVDVLYIYGLARAGYIPQMFSLRLPNPDVIYELLKRADAKALIYEPSLADIVTDCPYPSLSAVDLRDVDLGDATLPPMPEPASPEDIAIIFHTSGSTSGQPKLLPCNFKWLDNMVAKSATVSRPLRKSGQDVTVAMWVYELFYHFMAETDEAAPSGEACAILARPSCSCLPSKTARALSSPGLSLSPPTSL